MSGRPRKILYVYCHPLPESFHAGVRQAALKILAAAGHEVDLLDLYAEHVDPVLSEEGRRHYHDTAVNQRGLEDYVARLKRAEVLIVEFPTWCFGLPAMLKGFFDRLMMPGVAFDISDPARVKPMLYNIKEIIGIASYGRPRLMALGMFDPPRRVVTRYLRWFTGNRARVRYLAIYHMNTASERRRHAFVARVERALARI